MADFRAQQCQHLFEVVSMDFLAVDLQLEEVRMLFDSIFVTIKLKHFNFSSLTI